MNPIIDLQEVPGLQLAAMPEGPLVLESSLPFPLSPLVLVPRIDDIFCNGFYSLAEATDSPYSRTSSNIDQDIKYVS